MAYNAPKSYTNKPFADSSINYHLAPGDVLVECPYYPHKILQARLTTHLSKCMAQYKKDMSRNSKLPKLVICKDNWNHHIKEHEFEDHVQNHCQEARLRMIREEEQEKMFAAMPKPAQKEVDSASQYGGEEMSEIDVDESSVGNSVCGSVVGFPIGGRFADFDSGSVFSSNLTDVSSSSLSAGNVRRHNANRNSDGTTRTTALGEEDWEAELRVPGRPVGGPTIDIRKETKHIFYIPPGMAPSERREYRDRMVSLYADEMEERKAAAEAKAAEEARNPTPTLPVEEEEVNPFALPREPSSLFHSAQPLMSRSELDRAEEGDPGVGRRPTAVDNTGYDYDILDTVTND